MPLTRAFKETVKERIDEDPAFRDALLAEGIDALLSGEVDVGRMILRDFINATIGFAKVAEETGIPVKSLMRMFGPSGNPNARNLFAVIRVLQLSAGAGLRVRADTKRAKSRIRASSRALRRAG
jgi:DNA-binding phage protein